MKAKIVNISYVIVDLTGLFFCSSLFLLFSVNRGKTCIAQIMSRPHRGNHILNLLRTVSEVSSTVL